MEKSFIEVYENALPDDICDDLISLFENENANPSYDKIIRDSRTYFDDKDKKTFVSSAEMTLDHRIDTHNYFITKLDDVIMHKIFDYNKKYYVWSSMPNIDLVSSKEDRELIYEEEKSPEILNHFVHRSNNWLFKTYKAPTGGYYGWHTDWGTMTSEVISRMMVAQLFLNDVEEGGETEFWHQNIKLKPKKGSLVLWPTGFTHMHR